MFDGERCIMVAAGPFAARFLWGIERKTIPRHVHALQTFKPDGKNRCILTCHRYVFVLIDDIASKHCEQLTRCLFDTTVWIGGGTFYKELEWALQSWWWAEFYYLLITQRHRR